MLPSRTNRRRRPAPRRCRPGHDRSLSGVAPNRRQPREVGAAVRRAGASSPQYSNKVRPHRCNPWCTMKSLAAHDRPREKLERLGASALGDNELLAIVLGHGRARASALDLANLMLGTGGLHGLVRARHGELQRLPGIGAARAAQVLAAIELGRRTLARAGEARPQMASPRAAAEF